MRHSKTIEQPERGSITRRQVIQGLAAVGVGVAASPFMSPQAGASEVCNKSDTHMVAAIFFESYATTALQRALRYAGDKGFVASLPQLLHARVNAPYDNIIWNTWFTSNSEESVVTTKQGNHVVVTVHGGGIFASPARIERSLRADLDRSNSEGLTGQYAAKITQGEANDLLDGKLPDGSNIPVYQFDELKRGIADLPTRYGVVLDYTLARKSKDGYESFKTLRDDPNMIIRAGGIGPLSVYLDKARDRNDTNFMGNWHPYNRIDPAQPQTRILRLSGNKGGMGSDGNDDGLGWGYDADYGVRSGGLIGLARYVAVSPRNVLTGLQYLDFES